MTNLARLPTFALAVAVLACSAGLVCAQAPAPEIERAVREFLYALYANDAAAFQARIIPEAGSEAMLGSQQLTPEQLQKLRKDIDGLTLRQVAAPWADGKAVYATQFRGVPFIIPMQRVAQEWKADVRFWLAMRRQATVRPQLTDPDMVAKGFLFHILAKKPGELQQYVAGTIRGEDYTAANDLPPGDLDHILSLCLEMPIVRARVGERVLLPSGEAAEGTDAEDTQLLIGLMGPVEVPFLLKRIGGAWKVVPQKYFEMLRKAGAI